MSGAPGWDPNPGPWPGLSCARPVSIERSLPAVDGVASGHFPQQCLYFLPLRQGQGSLRPTLGPERTGLPRCSTASAASLTRSLGPALGAPFPSAPVVEPPKAVVGS